jgi:hypothetical protein
MTTPSPAFPPGMPPTVSGKHIILALITLGLVGGIISQWYYYTIQHRTLELWGNESAGLMLNAPLVDALRLVPAGTPTKSNDPEAARERLLIGGQRLVVAERKDVSTAEGLLSLRASLIVAQSFDWSRSTEDCKPEWAYALEFNDGERQTATLLFAPNCDLLKLVDNGATISARPIAKGLLTFLKEQLPVVHTAASR